jgi:hypothetical protein
VLRTQKFAYSLSKEYTASLTGVIMRAVYDYSEKQTKPTLTLSIYDSTAPVVLGHFFSFLIHTQSAGLLWRGISPSQGRYLHKHRIKAHRHPCLGWDSNLRSQRSSGQRWFMPKTARPLWFYSYTVWVENNLFSNKQVRGQAKTVLLDNVIQLCDDPVSTFEDSSVGETRVI